MSRNKLESHPDARTASPGALVAQPQRVMQGSLRSLGKPSARTGQELRCMLYCVVFVPAFFHSFPSKFLERIAMIATIAWMVKSTLKQVLRSAEKQGSFSPVNRTMPLPAAWTWSAVRFCTLRMGARSQVRGRVILKAKAFECSQVLSVLLRIRY